MSVVFEFNILTKKEIGQICQLLVSGGVGVLPTDTIYGLHGSAKFPETIERIYRLKNREGDKPMIILISSLLDLDQFGIFLDEKNKAILGKVWPNPVSVVLSCPNPQFKYLHRGKESLAFRIHKDEFLQNILCQSGPLVSTSVNLAGGKSAESIDEAAEYFGDRIDLYVNKGELSNGSSTVIALKNGEIQVLRQGSFKLS